MTAALTEAARKLPRNLESLRALCTTAAAFALSLDAAGELDGVDTVCDHLTDAFSACDGVYAVTSEQHTAWDRDAAGEARFEREREEA